MVGEVMHLLVVLERLEREAREGMGVVVTILVLVVVAQVPLGLFLMPRQTAQMAGLELQTQLRVLQLPVLEEEEEEQTAPLVKLVVREERVVEEKEKEMRRTV